MRFSDRQSATLALNYLQSKVFYAQELKVNWAFQSHQREDTSTHWQVGRSSEHSRQPRSSTAAKGHAMHQQAAAHVAACTAGEAVWGGRSSGGVRTSTDGSECHAPCPAGAQQAVVRCLNNPHPFLCCVQIFVGDLGQEVTDGMLFGAFSELPGCS